MAEAGWYENPEDPGELRYWDGRQWTSETVPRPDKQPEQQGPPPPTGLPVQPAPVQGAERQASAVGSTPAPAGGSGGRRPTRKQVLIGIGLGLVVLGMLAALDSGSEPSDATTDARDATASSPELSLKVTNPDPSRTTTIRSDAMKLEGTVDPPFASVEVSVLGDEHDLHVAKSGRFSEKVKLGGKLGNRSINVTATLGSTQVTETVLVDKELTAAELEAKREAARQKRLEAKQERQEARAAAQAEREQELQDAIISFSGNGALNLGTVHVTEPSTLYWTNDGGLFSLSDAAYRIFVNSQGASGKTAAPAGSYRRVDVNAIGNWTVTIRPNELGPP